MPVSDSKKLKRLMVKELLMPFAMKRGLTSAQLDDLVHRDIAHQRFDLSASTNNFAHHMNEREATDWAAEFERLGSAPHIFPNDAQRGPAPEQEFGGIKMSELLKMPAEQRLRIANQVEAAKRAKKKN